MSLLVIALQGLSVWVAAGFIEKLLSNRPLGISAGHSGQIASFMDRLAVNLLTQTNPFDSLVVGVTILLSAALLTGLLRAYKVYVFAQINQTVLCRLRYEMFQHLTRMNLFFSQTVYPGEIASLFTKDVDQLKTAIIDAVDRIFMQPLRFLMGVTLMASLSVELTIWSLLLLGLSSITVHFVGDRIEHRSKSLAEKAAKLQAHLIEYLTTAILARSFGKEDYEARRLDFTSSELATADLRCNVLNSAVEQIIKNLFFLCGAILMLVGGYRVLVGGDLPGGVLLKITLLLPVVSYPMESIAMLYLSVRASVASAKRIFAFLDSEAVVSDRQGAKDFRQFRDSVELRNVHYQVEGKMVLGGVSLKICRGVIAVVVGPSGAGKTTLLSVIAGLTEISDGEVIVDGVDLRSLRGLSWREHIGIVTQESVFLNGTIRDNLLYVRPTATDAEMIQAMRQALLWNDKCIFADGLDTQIGNRGEIISAGERQRLAVARVVLYNPDFILMDEPTSMLDAENKRKMYDTISSVSKGRTLILATHDTELKSLADMEVHMEKGVITEVFIRRFDSPNPYESYSKNSVLPQEG